MPTTFSLPQWIDEVDATVDDSWDTLRGNAALDGIFYAASAAADFSLLWHGLNVVRWWRGKATGRDMVRVAVLIGAESLIVNQGLKRAFRRTRPDADPRDRPHHLRQPSTSSFPSGHASSAVMAAELLREGDPGLRRFYNLTAAIVGTSRLHVRIHHFSDVVAGAAVGALLNRVAKRVWPA